ncbi:transposable element Tcb2 transposase [Trichonephila clavipes]|nr:transposable element Tcb2 transposase [Trichonephila clavipes]
MSSCRRVHHVGRIIGMMEAGWSARRVARQLGHSDCVVRRCRDPWIQEMSFTRRPGSGHPRQTSRREDHFIARNAHVQPSASSAAIQAQVAPSLGAPVSFWTIRRRLPEGHLGSDESRFNLSSDGIRVHVLGPRGERLNPTFALERHTAPTAGVMVWSAIAYITWSPLVLIRGTMTTQRYVHDILHPHELPLTQRVPGAVFEEDNALPLTARVSQECYYPQCYYPSLSYMNSRFVCNRTYLGSFGMASWASHEFERTTANMERNVSRHHT